MENNNVLIQTTTLGDTLSEKANIFKPKNEVFGIELHAGVNFGGFVGGTINIRNNHGLTLTEEINGIRVRGPKCNKLVPWAAMKGVDYVNEDGSEPVTGKSRV